MCLFYCLSNNLNLPDESYSTNLSTLCETYCATHILNRYKTAETTIVVQNFTLWGFS
jgi:hypothetical protein